jgi:hypothetical protein
VKDPSSRALAFSWKANALIEPFKSISVLGKWPKNRLLGQVIAAD